MRKISALLIICCLLMCGCHTGESQIIEAPVRNIRSISDIEIQKHELFRTETKMYSKAQAVELLTNELSLKKGYGFSLKEQESSNGYWAYKFVFAETYDNIEIYGCDVIVRVYADGTIVEGFLADKDMKKTDVLLNKDKLLEMYRKDAPDNKTSYQYEKLCYLYREDPEAESPLCYLYIGDDIKQNHLFINAVTGNLEECISMATDISGNKK